jgi:hypothetical protein
MRPTMSDLTDDREITRLTLAAEELSARQGRASIACKIDS